MKGRSFVKKIIHECVVCLKFGGKPYRAPPPPPTRVSCAEIFPYFIYRSGLCRTTALNGHGIKGVDSTLYLLFNLCGASRATAKHDS